MAPIPQGKLRSLATWILMESLPLSHGLVVQYNKMQNHDNVSLYKKTNEKIDLAAKVCERYAAAC